MPTTTSTVPPLIDEIEMMPREDVLIAAAIIFFIAFFGLIFNILGIVVVMKNPILKNSFGSLCLSHSIANSGVLFVFFVWSAPATYIQATHTEGMINKLLGQLNILCWDACVYSHLVISFNRFFAIAIPARASFIFSRRNTLAIIGVIWFIASCHVFPYFWYSYCYITYDPITWTWNFAPTECGYVISTYTDYYTSVAIFIAMSTVDFSTLILLMIHRKHSHFASSDESIKRRKVEIRFFMQSCLQGALFFYEIFMFYYVSTLNSNQWYIFFTATFAWEICHCLDGFVVVLFHFRRRIFTGEASPICFFGLLLNLIAFLTILKSPHFQTAHGTLSMNHYVLNLSNLLIYFLWVTPCTYTQTTDADTLFGKIVGQVHVLLWTSMVYSHLALSLNRLVTVIYPSHVRSVFSHHGCLTFIFFIWLIGLFHVIPLFWYDHCFLTYEPTTWIWEVSMTKCSQTYEVFVMDYLNFIILIIAVITGASVVIYINIKSRFSRRHPETRISVETLIKEIAFLLVFLISTVLSNMFPERWEKYVLTTFSWQFYHLFESCLMLWMHFERKLLKGQQVNHNVSFINVENHHHPGHHHSHDLVLHVPHNVHHSHHHNQFSKVDTY